MTEVFAIQINERTLIETENQSHLNIQIQNSNFNLSGSQALKTVLEAVYRENNDLNYLSPNYFCYCIMINDVASESTQDVLKLSVQYLMLLYIHLYYLSK